MVQITAQIQVKVEKKIQNKFGSIKAYKTKLKRLRGQIKDNFEGYKTYHDLNQIIKDNRLKLKTRQGEIEENNTLIETIKEKIETLKENLKSDQLTLSDWLIDYKEKTGKDTIPDDFNNIVKIEIKKTASVVSVDK